MKIHEYQGKEILRRYSVPVPRGIPCFSVDEAVKAAQELGGPVWVVKAQIHAGGRGKGGGVKLARSIDEVRSHASNILGMMLKTHQTGPEGQKVRRLLIEEGADIRKEMYVGIVLDRLTQKICVMASSEGGMDIEEVAAKTPEKLHKTFCDVEAGLTDVQADDLAAKIGIPDASVIQARAVLQGLYRAFYDTDASLAEINPLILTGDGRVVALDAKMNFDSNALFRHPDIVAMRDIDEEDPAEIEASKFDLAYIQLDGNIGCLVNGAGLAMATMDTIKLFGGEPANFLDVGGGATAEKVTEAFKIMLRNPGLKAILVNIFGGIMRCDTIAEGVIAASKAVGLSVPLVVRMKGTNEELGKKLLAESGLPIISADTMADAARSVVTAAAGKSARKPAGKPARKPAGKPAGKATKTPAGKKPVAKQAETKKAEAKKKAAKKTSAKKAAVKRTAAKTAASKKPAAAKAIGKKTATKKTPTAAAKKAAAPKARTKKPAVAKAKVLKPTAALPKAVKAKTKKAAAKKASAGKPPVKKPAASKVQARKTAAGKPGKGRAAVVRLSKQPAKKARGKRG